ncbi:MAG TPA: hypothetical protein VGU66_06425 [Candidatus Elarobacter sp.]|nr:hypothetical protein [Candidatus Elarobacter sp.]
MMFIAAATVTLALAPYHGRDLPGSIRGTAKFALRVAGPPGARIGVRASALPPGWLVSFCTPRVCAPLRVNVDLPRSGSQTIELQAINTIPGAKPPQSIAVVARTGEHTAIDFTRATY